MIRPRAAACAVVLVSFLSVAVGGSCSDGGDDGDIEAFCALANDTERHQALFDGFDPLDADKARDTLLTAAKDLRDLRTTAPDDARAHLDVLIDAIREIDRAVTRIDPDDPDSIDAALQDVREREPDIAAANVALEELRSERCAGDAG